MKINQKYKIKQIRFKNAIEFRKPDNSRIGDKIALTADEADIEVSDDNWLVVTYQGNPVLVPREQIAHCHLELKSTQTKARGDK